MRIKLNYCSRDINPRYNEYLQYLDSHIYNANLAWHSILMPFLESRISYDDLTKIDAQISKHDRSKYSKIEFIPYLNHYYPSKGYFDDDELYDSAWLHHQKFNSHHWQSHILIRDSGDLYAMDMPLADIAEMICDWHSFCYLDPSSTAYNWFKDNSDNLQLSQSTYNMVSKLICLFK